MPRFWIQSFSTVYTSISQWQVESINNKHKINNFPMICWVIRSKSLMAMTSHFDLKMFKLGYEWLFLSLFAVEVESKLFKFFRTDFCISLVWLLWFHYFQSITHFNKRHYRFLSIQMKTKVPKIKVKIETNKNYKIEK